MENEKAIQRPGKGVRLWLWFRKKSFIGKGFAVLFFVMIAFLVYQERENMEGVVFGILYLLLGIFSVWLIKNFSKRKLTGKVLTVIYLLWFVVFSFGERYLLAVVFLPLRIWFATVVVWGLILWLEYKLLKGNKKKWGLFLGGIIILVLFIFKMWPWEFQTFVTSYYRYQTLDVVNITRLPETANEPIQPLISIHGVAEQKAQGAETISRPNLVRDTDHTDHYAWTAVLEPSENYIGQQLFSNIGIAYSIPIDHTSPDFSERHQSVVDFSIGESLMLSCQSHTEAMRTLSFFDLFTVEAGEPRFMRDDGGKWVEVIPLIRWNGIFFPRPEFGGVHVVHQGHEEPMVKRVFKRFLFGVGVNYTPEQMKKFKYLQNQNLMPAEVAESIASSFRFKNHWYDPLPRYHYNDTRIPPNDYGDGEHFITQYFKMSQVVPGAKNKLYEYVALEPYDTLKHGIVASLFIPSDGQGPVYMYSHGKDGLGGLSTAASKVRGDHNKTDWSSNRVAGVRCYNRVIDGKFHSFWMATVVTRTQTNKWVASSPPETAIIDSQLDRVVWVDPDKPETWVGKIKAELSDSWNKK